MRAVYGRAHPDRPAHAARRLPAPARRRRGELPARVGRAGPARTALLHRLRQPARLLRGGGGARRAGRRLPRLRPRREARADGASFPPTARSSPRAASSSPRRSSASTTAAARRKCSRATATRSQRGSNESLCFRNTIPPRSAQPCGGRPTRPRTKRAWSGSASTSAPGTRSRSCSRSGRSGRRPRRRSSSTARCAASTPRPTSSCSSSASWRWSAPRPRRSSSARTAAPA